MLPAIVQSWRRVQDRRIPFFAFPAQIRKTIYTTNAIESLRMQYAKCSKIEGTFPATMRQQSNFTWLSTISLRSGKIRPLPGSWLQPSCDPVRRSEDINIYKLFQPDPAFIDPRHHPPT